MAETPVIDRLSWQESRSMDPVDRVDYYCVLQDDGCYVWTGATTKGYGMVQIAGHSHRVHQWVWENENGPLPIGHHLHHLCRTKACRELSHLQLLPAGEHNLTHGTRGQAALNAEKTHCKNDHPLEGDNLWVEKNGARHCKTCRAEAARRFRARKKG